MSPSQREIVVDLFAGGGGASTGIRAALGRDVDIAQNHDLLAMEVHEDNHPGCTHIPEDVWKTRPREVTGGRPVGLLWASPDCTHHSRAKGGKPREKGIRALADVVVVWAREVLPRVIMGENVREFLDWGPLYEVGDVLPDGTVLTEGHRLVGTPDPARKGEFFRAWVGKLRALGYVVEWRVLNAADYGAPTARHRLFIVARRDGLPIRWPEPSHGPGRAHPHRTAAECIDWSLPCPSIFERKRPLAEKTLWRVAEGIRRFVLENPRPFIVGVGGRAGQTPPTSVGAPLGTATTKADKALCMPSIVKVNHGGMEPRGEPIDAPLSTVTAQQRGHALVAPTLIQTGYGERKGQEARVLDLHQPIGTLVNGQKHALVAAFLAKHFGGVVGHGVTRPLGTVTATDHHSLAAATLVKLRGECNGADVLAPLPTITAEGTHIAEVRAFLTTYYGSGSVSQAVDRPMRTITSLARLGLVLVQGEHGPEYFQITDIGLRMLEPEELLAAQFGRFAKVYDLSAARSKRDKVRLIGNSVPPEVAEALVLANLGAGTAERRAA